MKRISTLILIALFASMSIIAEAKTIKAPTQSDTLMIHEMNYNGTTIRKENWPAEVIILSGEQLTLGDASLKIKDFKGVLYDEYSKWFGRYDLLSYTLQGGKTLGILRLHKSSSLYPLIGLTFNGYSVLVYNKNLENEYKEMIATKTLKTKNL